jgi:hypothetical protein
VSITRQGLPIDRLCLLITTDINKILAIVVVDTQMESVMHSGRPGPRRLLTMALQPAILIDGLFLLTRR